MSSIFCHQCESECSPVFPFRCSRGCRPVRPIDTPEVTPELELRCGRCGRPRLPRMRLCTECREEAALAQRHYKREWWARMKATLHAVLLLLCAPAAYGDELEVLIARVEGAALRAERAAESATASALRANDAADRAEAIALKVEERWRVRTTSRVLRARGGPIANANVGTTGVGVARAEAQPSPIVVGPEEPPPPETTTYTTTTGDDGHYTIAFPDGPWRMVLRRNGGACAGITALDAAWVKQAVLGQRTLTPEQALAADVTGNGKVTATDAARIVQYVVKKILRFPAAEACASDWLFRPEWDGATAITQPSVGPSGCTMGSIEGTGSADGVHWRGILIGDVTGNWQPCEDNGTAALQITKLAK